jgi:hypothetical protein
MSQTLIPTVLLAGGGVPSFDGIKFPASQVSSSDVNTLDDYEEGTWTPALTIGGGTTGITYSVQTGKYSKVGNIVSISIEIVTSSKGALTGSVAMAGLPFTSNGNSGLSWWVDYLLLGANIYPMFCTNNGGTGISCQYANSGANGTIQNTQLAATTNVFRLAGTYIST